MKCPFLMNEMTLKKEVDSNKLMEEMFSTFQKKSNANRPKAKTPNLEEENVSPRNQLIEK